MNREETAFIIIMGTVTKEPTDWSTILDAVRQKMNVTAGPQVMRVRGVLQFCLDEDLIARTKDLHVEQYVKLTEQDAKAWLANEEEN